MYNTTYGNIDSVIHSSKIDNWNNSKFVEICSAPTQSLLQKWLREECNIVVWYEPFTLGTSCTFMWNIGLFENVWHLAHFSMRKHTTCEEALEEGLQKALKLI